MTNRSNGFATKPRKQRLRVAMVAACPFPANHGTPGAIRELSLALAKQGHEVHVVTYPHGEDQPVDGLTIHRVSASFLRPGEIKIGPSLDRLVFDALMVPKLLEVIREHGIDVIHAHNYEATIAGALTKFATHVPLVYNGINNMADELPSYGFMGSDTLARLFGKLLDHLVPRSGDALIVLSEELKTYLESLGMPADKIIVVPPGVIVEDFSHGNGARARARHGISAETPLVVYAGALERFQRVDLLVAAMARVLADKPEARLLLINNIPNATTRREIEEQAGVLGISKQIIFAESVSLVDLPDCLAAGDVAVVPRPSCPGFPVKLLNYMAAGKAIVSFEGSAKCLCHGFNGYVAKNGDSDDLAVGISLLLNDDALRATLGERARQSLRGVYDWDTLAEATALIYGQVISAGRQLNRRALSGHVKASYTPQFADGGRDNPQGFLQSGPIEYPSF